MLSDRDLTTLQAVCRAGLSSSALGVADLFDLLGRLDTPDKRQFWVWLKQKDTLLHARLNRSGERLKQAKGA